MPDPNSLDDTRADYEQLERELLAQDQDAARVSTADIDEETTRHLVTDLVDMGIVSPVLEDRVLVHEPSGTVFDSSTQLAVFHRGWTAAHNTDEEDD